MVKQQYVREGPCCCFVSVLTSALPSALPFALFTAMNNLVRSSRSRSILAFALVAVRLVFILTLALCGCVFIFNNDGQSTAQAQVFTQPYRDSIQAALAKHTTNDSIRAKLLNTVAFAHNTFDPHYAIQLASEAERLADSLHDRRQMAEALRIQAFAEQRMGRMSASMKQYLKALPIFERLNDSLGIANCYNGIGIVHFEQSKYSLAIEYYQKSLQYSLPSKSYERAAASLVNLGYLYAQQQRLAEAEECTHRALALDTLRGMKLTSPFVLCNFSEVARRQGKLDKAERYATQALSASHLVKNKVAETRALSILGFIASERKQHRQALAYLHQAIDAARSAQLRYRLQDGYFALSLVSAKMGDFRAAYCYRDTFKLYRDTLTEETTSVAAVMLDARREQERKALELALLAHNNQTQTRWLMVLGAALALVLVLVALLVRSNARVRQAYRQMTVQNTLLDKQTKRMQEQSVEIQEANTALNEQNTTLQGLNAALERTNSELTQANEVRSRLLSMASHDLKNPLGAVIGFAAVLQMQAAEDEFIRSITTQILSASERMLALVRDLLDKAAHDLGKMELHAELMDMASLLRDTVTQAQPTAARKSQTLTLKCDDNLFTRGEAKRLHQVMENLISNAVKYSPPNAYITVTGSQVNGHILVSVCDEGPGLTDEDQQKLFGFFQRLSAKPTAGEESHGVGLAVVKQIIELHGGKIWAENNAHRQNNAPTHVNGQDGRKDERKGDQTGERKGELGATFLLDCRQHRC
jgi:signal transduction histidine kinase